MSDLISTISQSAIQFYGTDWLGMVLIVLSIYLIGEENKIGFILGVLGSLSWVVFALLVKSYPTLFLNITLVFLNTRGYLKWSSK